MMPIKRKTLRTSPEIIQANRDSYNSVDFSDYIPSQEPKLNPNLQYLENNEDFQEDMELYMQYIASQDDNFIDQILSGTLATDDWKEFMRDEDWRITSVIDRNMALKDAPEDVKQAYKRVRENWERADVEGYGEWVEAITDMGLDAVGDPVNLAMLLAIPFTGGGSAATAALAKEGAKKSAMQTIKRMAVSPTTTGVVEGGVWAGVDNYNRQNIEIATGMRNEFSNSDFAMASGIGSLAGGVFGKAFGYFGNSKNAAKVERDIVPDNKALDRQADNLAANDDEIVDNIIEGNLPQSQEVVDAVSEVVSRLPLRSATFQNGVLNETRGFPLDFDIDDFADVDEIAKDLAEKLGGGDYTAEEIADTIRQSLVAAKRGNVSGDELSDFITGRITKGLDTPPEQLAPTTPDPSPGQEVARPIQNKLLFKIGRIANKLNSTVLAGKATDLISPYAKYSATAARLQRLLRYDSSLKLTGSLTPDEKLGRDYFETLKENYGTFVTNFKKAYEPIALGPKGDTRQDMDDMIVAALRGGALPDNAPDAVKNIVPVLRKLFDDRAEALFMEEVPANYVPRMWKRSAIEQNQFEFKKLLENEGYAPEEADSILQSMLSKTENSAVIDSAGTGDTVFLMPRVLDKIADDNVYANFLENDLNKIVHEYGMQSARRISKLNVLGVRNKNDFEKIWIPQIQKELREAGLEVGDPLIGKAANDISAVYSSMTGEGIQRYGSTVQTAADSYTMLTRMATLPLAPLSSLTEIFLNISKAGFRNSFKGLAVAMNEGFTTMSTKSKNLLADAGLTEPEIWREMQELGIAMDQAAGDVADRLGGETIANDKIRTLNNAFFRANMLDQWTKFVQMTSYITGKNMISDNIADIAAARGSRDSRRILRKKKELRELGVDIDQAMDWFDGGMKADDAFNKEIQRGAGRYTNEVILNPESASGLKPLMHSNPKTSILFQLMGYPAAFTNTILKNAARKMIEDPRGNVPNTLAAGLIMTETARFTNWARSRGRSEEEGENPYAAAIMRWGGGGVYLDMFRRAEFAAKDSPALAPVLGISGPLSQDIFALARYQGPVEFAARKSPGFGAFEFVFGREFRDNYTSAARSMDKVINDMFSGKEPDRLKFKKGGEVYDVPNASAEPDERVDRMTGLPYDQQAGGAFVDEEERIGFALGTVVTKYARSALSDAVGKIANKGENIPFNRLMKRLEVEGVRPDEIEASRLIDLVDEKDIVTTRSGNKAVTAEGLRSAEARRTDVFKQEESTYLEAQEEITEVAEDLEREVEITNATHIMDEAFDPEDLADDLETFDPEVEDPTYTYTGRMLDTALDPEKPLRERTDAISEVERVLRRSPAELKEMYTEVVPEDAELSTYRINYYSDPRVTRPTRSGHFIKGRDYPMDLNFAYWTRGDVASGDKTITGGEASRVFEIQSDSTVALDPEKLSPYQKLLQEFDELNDKIGEIEDSILDVDMELEKFDIVRSSSSERAVVPPDAEEAVKTLIKRNNELMDELTSTRKQQRGVEPKLKDASKNMTASEVKKERDEIFYGGTKVPINVWKNAIHNEIIRAKENGLDEIQFLIDDKLVERNGQRVTEFMIRSPEIQKAYQTIVAPLVIKTAKKIGARAQRKGKYIAFALPASFTLPLYAQEQEDLSEVATDLSLGMELDEALVANRDSFAEGGLLERAIKFALGRGAKAFGFGADQQRQHEKEVVALVNEAAEKGFIPERSRIPTDEAGFGRFSGADEEVFNAFNHAYLVYKHGSKLKDPLLQGKEYLQMLYYPNPDTERVDQHNNAFGSYLRDTATDDADAKQKIVLGYYNTQRKLAEGKPLVYGEDLIFNVNDLENVEPRSARFRPR